MANTTERMRIAAAVATGGASNLGGGGGGLGGRQPANVTEEGARYNYARDMDTRGVGASGDGASSEGGTAGRSPKVVRIADHLRWTPRETIVRLSALKRRADRLDRAEGAKAEDGAISSAARRRH
jgi:hypothetical protein